MDDETKRAIARWRVAVLGPLISARLEHGDRAAWFRETAARVQQLPDGRHVKLSARTIEAWFFAYRHGGYDALLPQTRGDAGHSRAVSAELADLIVRAKKEKPRRSIRRIIRMLERAGRVARGDLSHSTVHRLLQREGVSSRPLRGPTAERRSFIFEHASDLWVGDALHGPKVIAPEGGLRKAYLISLIDCATRFVPHSQFMLSEGSVAHEHVLKQVLLKYGLARAYYVDRGAAYKADSLDDILAELGVRLIHAGAGDAAAKGVIERWNRTWREEVGDELPDHPLTLAELNARHWAWLSVEYSARRHETTGRIPRDHWIAEAHELLPLPRNKNMNEVFLHRVRRKVRNDGTVRFAGGLLEVRAELTGRSVELRFDPNDLARLPRVFIDNEFYCDTVVLDRVANATRARRRNLGAADPTVKPTGLDPLALILQEHDQHARAAVIAALAEDESDDDTTED